MTTTASVNPELGTSAARCPAGMGLSDGEIGAIAGMTPRTVLHYAKRKRTFMTARGAAERMRRGAVLPLKAGPARGGME